MATTTVTPFGEWPSPIAARSLTHAARRLSFPALVDDELWWCEDRPDEGGRTTVMARRGDGDLVELLSAPWSARTRVHEYGGRSFLPLPGPAGASLIFTNGADQRIYRLDPGAAEPHPLTPPANREGAPELRYADLTLVDDEIWCVREHHLPDGDLERAIVSIPLDGAAGQDPNAVVVVVEGARFLAHPRRSPDGTRLAWLAWDHPRMPWDGTELRVGLLRDGQVTSWSTVLGGPSEAVYQPEWDGDDHLITVSDRSGWWNLYRVPAPGVTGELTPLHPAEAEFAAPLWQLGAASWGRLTDGRLLCVHGAGNQQLGVLDPATGALTELPLPYQSLTMSLTVADDRAALVAASPDRPTAVVQVDVAGASHEVVRTAVDPEQLPDPRWLPVAETTTLTGPDGREVHTHIYPPRNPEHTGPPGARPPYVVFVHGGPTSNSPAALDLAKAYLTSRGIGVLDVNYGGSSGYGRAYRERLAGQWGIVDVQDAATAAAALVLRGDADPRRLAIRGGSAGGWTTLCAVTGTEVFAAGTSLFGVTDVRRLAEITHDFESRYVTKLVGEAELAHDTRSPLHRADRTRCPVLLLQGSDDPVVPAEQAEQFRDALAANDIPHALLVFPGEQHGFRKAESIIAAAEAELSFYGQVMGFDPVGVPRLPLSSAQSG
ncbi:S9 family peptidase [Natronosporangium hydrolyticum]|uniref:S9 family peptidase n=1 Tax=Natronosporangium hydrolyticum TaxID=2811111 RepID=A0A895YPI2_9ACTN|nr:prolyl oligopeptidase family serine peptidase [Natronosporangium hydrolyticum]QSB15878.1 S9 family peptidase [Natronosporangium hydrolyticum]